MDQTLGVGACVGGWVGQRQKKNCVRNIGIQFRPLYSIAFFFLAYSCLMWVGGTCRLGPQHPSTPASSPQVVHEEFFTHLSQYRVQDILNLYSNYLLDVYRHYSMPIVAERNGRTRHRMSFVEFNRCLTDARLLDDRLTPFVAQRMFSKTQVLV